MIQPNELRMGSLIEKDNVMYKFLSLEQNHTSTSEYRWYSVETLDGKLGKYYSSHFNPIPLTPEILEKCGFVKPSKNDNHGGLLVSIGNDVSIRLKPLISGEGYYWDNFNGAYKVIIKHLHQLQNLYWCLCRKELEINLQ